jgi:hypothetical protein
MICNYCNKDFKSTNSFLNHKARPPKRCLVFRSQLPTFCIHCSENVDDNITHLQTCLPYITKLKESLDVKLIESASAYQELRLVNIETNAQLFSKTAELSDYKWEMEKTNKALERKTTDLVNTLEKKDIEIKFLRELLDRNDITIQTEKNRYDKLATKCVETPSTNITYGNNTFNSNNVHKYLYNVGHLTLGVDNVRSNFEKYTYEYFQGGIGGLAMFAIEHVLKDSDGNKNYITCDTSRSIFKYRTSDGIERDIKANDLLNTIVPLALERVDQWFDPNTDYDYGDPYLAESPKSYNTRKLNTKAYDSIRNIQSNPKQFCELIAKKLCVPDTEIASKSID